MKQGSCRRVGEKKQITAQRYQFHLGFPGISAADALEHPFLLRLKADDILGKHFLAD